MMMIQTQNKRRNGQALLEFALTIPLIIFVVMGIIDFSRVLFTYAQASNSLRAGLRYAEIYGFESSSIPPYLNCSEIISTAENIFFTSSAEASILYRKADFSGLEYTCDDGTGVPVQDSFLANGDILQVTLVAEVKPFFLPYGNIVLNFQGQRTIVKEIVIGGRVNDKDGDGLDDDWETFHFPGQDIKTITATDDPDGDGCNNGCEEDAGTDPNDPNDFPIDLKPDVDEDGHLNGVDNCPTSYNPAQTDTDGDGIGDACDPTPNGDTDNDGIDNLSDNCPFVHNPSQADMDGDGIGDACDPDRDGDGVTQPPDNCPDIPNPSQADINNNGVGNACEDTDGDGYLDGVDNCPLISNPDQADQDGDGIGDLCDADRDGDGHNNVNDNCPLHHNPNQADFDGDGVGDACDFPDGDGDGIDDVVDNCPLVANTNQSDIDGDGIGDACDNDMDEDGIPNNVDNCPLVANTHQSDIDGDGIGDACDNDIDGDGLINSADNCQMTPNPDQADMDGDGIGDACDNDIDGDGFGNAVDNCPLIPNPDQLDSDSDGIGDVCDPTPYLTSIIQGYLRKDNGKNCGNNGTYPNQTVTLQTLDAGGNPTGAPLAIQTNSSGYFKFANLNAGNYRLTIPATVGSPSLQTYKLGTAGPCTNTTNTNYQWLPLSGGQTVTLYFGYK